MGDPAQYPHYIEFRRVSKSFEQPVLIDCSFHLDSGKTLSIIGRSGVGKSVTLSLLMGFLKADEGRVIVAHEDITDYPERELNRIHKKVTMVFQSGALFDSLTVAENVAFGLRAQRRADAARDVLANPFVRAARAGAVAQDRAQGPR